MAEQKVLAVVGATGAQGGGLVRAILDDPKGGFRARAIARNPGTDKAKKLEVEVVAADLDNEGSLDRALDGAYGAYFVTFYWAHFSPEKEKSHAAAMARAAKRAGLKHVIWSTLEDTRRWVPLDDPRMPTLMEHYKVPHFDAKGESDHYFADQNVPTTYLLTSFYWDNFIYFGMGPKAGADGKLAITFPMADRKLPGIAAEDIGRCAYGIFKNKDAYLGKTVGVAGEHLTGTEMATSFSRAMGRDVAYHAVEPEVYRSLGFPGADDLGNMFQFKRDFNEVFCGARGVGFSRSLNPRLQGFDQWLAANKSRIQV